MRTHRRPAVVLVMEDAFHQGWLGPTRRVFHITEALNGLGFEVILLAGRMTNVDAQKAIDSMYPGVVLRTPHSGNYPSLIDSSAALRRIWRATWKILRGEDVYWSNLSWGWGRRLDVDHVARSLADLGVDPVLCWAFSGGYLAAAVGATRLSERLDVPCIFELHDPPWRAGLKPDLDVVKEEFSRQLNFATHVVVTAEHYGYELEKTYGVPRQKWTAIHLTYEEGERVSPGAESSFELPGGSEGKFRVVYAGSLTGNRTLMPLFRAVAKLTTESPEIGKSIYFDLAGAGAGFGDIAEFAESEGLEKQLYFRGMLGAKEAEQLLNSADMIVIMQPESSRWEIPGKTYESLVYGKPILGIMPPYLEAADLLRRAGLGFIHEQSDVDGIACTIRRLWESWESGAPSVTPDHKFIQTFSSVNLPQKVERLLSPLVDIPRPLGSGNVSVLDGGNQ